MKRQTSTIGRGGRNVRYCIQCLTPNTRPRVILDEKGVCNACKNSEAKKSIDWKSRRDEFENFIEPYRSKSGEWDCVVPWSGGKDSSAIAYRMKFEFGMNPLLTTFSPMIPNDVGQINRERIIQLGFDHLFHRPNQAVQRRLARRFFIERGNPKVAWDAGITAFPVQVAARYKIPIVLYAEHGESEYGGRMIREDANKFRSYSEVIEHGVGDDPRNWEDDGIGAGDLNPYLHPDGEEIGGIVVAYFAYFFKWSILENYHFIKTKIDFAVHPEGRTSGTFTNFDSLDDKIDALYYYMQFIKFGFGRCVRDASRLIQNGQMRREEGLKVSKLYDHEFPEENIAEVLEYLDLERSEFEAIVDKHRNLEIWERNASGWQLRFPLE